MTVLRRNYDTVAYWMGCDAQELRIARCADCHAWVHFPRGVCPECWSDDVRPEAVTGTGRVITFSVPRVSHGAAPVVTAVVEMSEASGARLLGRVVGCLAEEVSVGQVVALDWANHDGQQVPCFRAVEAAS